jgi:hypothetical protein
MRKAQAVITAALGLPMWIDLIVEYVASFGFGLLIFQALFMKGMRAAPIARHSAARSCRSACR